MQPDERFFAAFLPVMIGVGVLIVIGVVLANVVAARRRHRAMPPPFVAPIPDGNPFGIPHFSPHTYSKTTTTTNADGSVTVTVIEERTGSTVGSVNDVIDPELFTNGVGSGVLEQEILAEVRDAFRKIGSRSEEIL